MVELWNNAPFKAAENEADVALEFAEGWCAVVLSRSGGVGRVPLGIKP